MSETSNLNDPWFIAAWPGLGNVAVGAAGFLLHALDFKPVGALRDADHYEEQRIRVEDGLVDPTILPHGRFYAYKNPTGRDLFLFTSDAQPSFLGHRYCDELLEVAQRQGAERVVAFAGLLNEEMPVAGTPSAVKAVADSVPVLEEVCEERKVDCEPLASGELVGLNAVLLARASQRGLEAIGLLGEVPAASANLPCLKASVAVLEAFSKLSGIEFDLDDMRGEAASMDERLRKLVSRAKRLSAGGPLMLPGPSFLEGLEVEEDEEEQEPGPAPGVLAEIEALFARAREDRSVAYELKEKLDEHELFGSYEDRFLDLFSSR